jgi:hypothetical protein
LSGQNHKGKNVMMFQDDDMITTDEETDEEDLGEGLDDDADDKSGDEEEAV